MSFKETEVGKIPKEWNVDFIDNIKSNKKNAIAMGPFGSNIKKENFVDYGIPVIRGNNLSSMRLCEDEFIYLTEEKADKLKSSEVNRGDIVITHRGTLGQVSYVPYNSKYKKYIVSQSGMKLTCDTEKADPIFINYFLNSRIGQYLLLRNKSQVGVPSIATPTTSLKKIHVPLPTLGEQKAIANILSTLDDKIEVNNKINQKLEEMAQTIFKQWFIDFDFPNEEGKPYKSSGGEVVESELGMIPKGWEVKMIKDFGEVITGKTPSTKKKENYGDKYPFITIPDMHNTMFINTVERYLSEEGHNSQPKKLIPKNSIIVSCIATVGLVGINSIDSHTNQQINSVIPNNERLLPYLYFTIKDKKEYLNLLGSAGTTTKNVNKGLFESIKIVNPKNELIEKFYEMINSSLGKIEKNIVENEKLEKTRDTLLPKLMSGEMRVPINKEN